jgi:cytochrome c oxidase subunit 2
MWIDPHETGVYLGQCAQYCGTQHAKMLLRVFVQSREDFDRWVASQQRPVQNSDAVARGQQVFDTTACVNCHTIPGRTPEGLARTSLLMSRERLRRSRAQQSETCGCGSGPDAIKPGSLMPAMQLATRTWTVTDICRFALRDMGTVMSNAESV